MVTPTAGAAIGTPKAIAGRPAFGPAASPSLDDLIARGGREFLFSRQRRSPGGQGGRAPLSPRSGASLDNKKKLAGPPRPDRLPRVRFVRPTRGHVYPPQKLGQHAWKTQTADALQAEAEALPHGKLRKALLRKATAFRLCGIRTRVLVCNNCKASQLGSGIQTSAGHPCQTRICPCCQRRSAQKRRAELRDSLANIAVPEGYGFKHITFTTRYNPRSEGELTIEALRSRIDGLLLALRAALKAGLRRKGTGLSFTIEIAGSGHVHLHALYLGPFVVKAWLEKVLNAAYERTGFTYVTDVSDENILFEVTKYHTKAPSPLREAWFETATDVIHPVLAARWEVATSGRQLHGKFGAFRRRKDERTTVDADGEGDKEATATPAAVDDALTAPCASCGRCAGYTEHEVDTFEWVARCHAAGAPAFRQTRITPLPLNETRPVPDAPLQREVITL